MYSRPTSHLLRKRKRKGAASVTLEASMQIFQYGQAGQKGLKSPLKLLEDIYIDVIYGSSIVQANQVKSVQSISIDTFFIL